MTPLPPSARPGASGEGPPEGEQATFTAAVAERVAAVRSRIDAVAAGRPVVIVAVTKGFGPGAVDAARGAGLTVVGLMGIGPTGPPRPALFTRLAATGGRLGLAELSMGMTADYEVAVAEGSTMVRLGTALFGPRPRPPDLRR